jgi:hypothetical protein
MVLNSSSKYDPAALFDTVPYRLYLSQRKRIHGDLEAACCGHCEKQFGIAAKISSSGAEPNPLPA